MSEFFWDTLEDRPRLYGVWLRMPIETGWTLRIPLIRHWSRRCFEHRAYLASQATQEYLWHVLNRKPFLHQLIGKKL